MEVSVGSHKFKTEPLGDGMLARRFSHCPGAEGVDELVIITDELEQSFLICAIRPPIIVS